MSSAMSLNTLALNRLHLSNSIKHLPLGPSSIKPIYIAFAANRDMCRSFLQNCVDYGEKVLACCLPSIASSTSSRVAPRDFWEQTKGLWSEMTGISVEKAASVQGLSS